MKKYNKVIIMFVIAVVASVFSISANAAEKLNCSHSFSVYTSDNNATYFSDGTKSAVCDNGCGKNKTIVDKGTMLTLSKPGKVTATQTSGSITLNWSKVEGATGYRIYYKIDDGWKKLVSSTKKTTFTVNNLKAGFKVKFAVRAYKKGSDKTVWAKNKTEIYTSTKCESVKKITSTSGVSTVKLSWNSVKGADGYRIYRKTSDGLKTLVKSTKKNSVTLKNLTSGKNYTFAVRPYVETSSKVFSASTAHKTSTVTRAPETKITLVSKNKIKLTFKGVNGAEGYEIYRKINNGSYKLYKTYNKPRTISITVKPDKYYTYAVRAYKKSGNKTVYGKYNPVSLHCSNAADRVIVNPNQKKWNLILVNTERELPYGYIPKLESIPNGYELDYRVAPYYNKMYNDALEDGIVLTPISAYRSASYQAELFEMYTLDYMYAYGISRAEAEAMVAKEVLPAGTSEHNLGFAVDVCSLSGYFGQSAEYQWMFENAHKYGFIERYTAEKESITKIIPEPWHWRFVGVEYAKKIKNSGLCLEEYLEKHNLIP